MALFTRKHTLFKHISFRLILLSLITVLTIGIPAIIYLHFEMEKQTWAQIDQGARTSFALFEVNEFQLTSKAKLIAERPTLLDLLELNNPATLVAYLTVLQEGVGSDAITICGKGDEVLAETHQFNNVTLCPSQNRRMIIQNSSIEAWTFRSHPIQSEEQEIGAVIVGDLLDDNFAHSMSNEIGLQYFIFHQGKVVASSLNTIPPQSREVVYNSQKLSPIFHYNWLKFTIGGTQFYGMGFSLSPDGLEGIVAFPVAEFLATSAKQLALMLGGMFVVLGISVFLSSVIARRISQPLEALSSMATRSRSEFMQTPIATDSQITELVELANAYEHARVDLSHKVGQLQKEQDWIRHLLEAIAEGILTLDSENKILFFSPAAERITGWKRDEVLYHPVDNYFRLVDKDGLFSDNLPYPGEKSFLAVELAEKRQATLSISGAEFMPSEASDSQKALVFRDVTEEVAINRLLGQFLSNVAHEFRTPLSALSASVELLEDQFPDFNSDEVMELIRSQKLGVLGLETLIDNLLESSSIEARRFRVTPRTFDIEEIITDVEQTLSPLLEKHGQRLVVKIPVDLPLVYGDPRRTVQVLINLLSNAIKYGPEDSEITLQAIERDRIVRVLICDRGPGISPEYRQEIFTRFNIPRMESERAKPGAGLGLSVVKAIVEAQGGEVGVEDSPGSGACFWFTMRLAKSK